MKKYTGFPKLPTFTYIIKNAKLIKVYKDMEEYVTASLKTHLFFGRIMKEHALFLQAEERLRAGCGKYMDHEMADRMGCQIRRLNQCVLQLLNGLIMFKKQILREVTSCRLYTANYPLLIEHIIREAELYRQILTMLEEGNCISQENIAETEMFWNQIMMEHALFIRGLLDPTECELIETADTFAGNYCQLLEEARQQDCSDECAEKENAENDRAIS